MLLYSKTCLQRIFNICVYATLIEHSSPSAVPISSLEPITLVEGQSYRQAAYCRSVAHPPPRLSWDTDLNGQSTNRSSGNGVVTAQYSLYPVRNMNGMKLDCLVWHPTLAKPRRLSNQLVVHCEYLFVPPEQQYYKERNWTMMRSTHLFFQSLPAQR